MDKTFQRFLKLGINLAPVGIEAREDNAAYFCTPKGACIFGWAGVDGIHYCFIRGFGNMIFAVSPMNAAPNYVHPIAENFETLLRLLLACGDAAALEQAWQWKEEEFNAFLAENPPTEEGEGILKEIVKKLKLSPMEHPWQYLHALQESFDYGKIKYTEDVIDPDSNVQAEVSAPEWKVYFDGNFWGHHGRARAGKEIPIGKGFDWAGRHWLIPAAYSCSKGLIVDFCMRVEAEAIRAFLKKWNLSEENDGIEHFTREEQMEMECDNPMCLQFIPQLTINGSKVRYSRGCAVSYNPCLPDGLVCEWEAKWVVEHYGLDAACGWVVYRYVFPWNRRPSELKTLSLALEEQPERIPGPHFKVRAPGDCFRFVHPISLTEYTLTVRELERQTLPENCFASDRFQFPTYCTVMSYTLSPKTSESITICDADDGDRPIAMPSSERSFAPSATPDAACIGVIGGADGPTTVFFGGSQGALCTACSALRFELDHNDVEWRITFHEKLFADFSVILR